MAYISPPQASQRSPRTSFAETTPAVVRHRNGSRVSGKLQIISLTGGLLSLPRPINQGAQVKLMFLTSTGSVLGKAEMLSAISWTLQPFKFVGLHRDDERKLRTAIQSSLDHSRRDRVQVERHRAW